MTTIEITERYYNQEYLDILLNVDCNAENYPSDEERFITQKEQTKLKGVILGSKLNNNTKVYEKPITFQKILYGDIPYGRFYPSNDVTS